jgi:hypothetical protein
MHSSVLRVIVSYFSLLCYVLILNIHRRVKWSYRGKLKSQPPLTYAIMEQWQNGWYAGWSSYLYLYLIKKKSIMLLIFFHPSVFFRPSVIRVRVFGTDGFDGFRIDPTRPSKWLEQIDPALGWPPSWGTAVLGYTCFIGKVRNSRPVGFNGPFFFLFENFFSSKEYIFLKDSYHEKLNCNRLRFLYLL